VEDVPLVRPEWFPRGEGKQVFLALRVDKDDVLSRLKGPPWVSAAHSRLLASGTFLNFLTMAVEDIKKFKNVPGV
jgi:hypothetical protein